MEVVLARRLRFSAAAPGDAQPLPPQGPALSSGIYTRPEALLAGSLKSRRDGRIAAHGREGPCAHIVL